MRIGGPRPRRPLFIKAGELMDIRYIHQIDDIKRYHAEILAFEKKHETLLRKHVNYDRDLAMINFAQEMFKHFRK